MMSAHTASIRILGIAALGWVCLWAVFAGIFPAFPIDETRYLTVAWNMLSSGDYVLPTLNGEPYSHKPPMLFWLINLAWSVGGPSVAAARVVPLFMSLGAFFLTFALARKMFPERHRLAIYAALILLVMPAFEIFGALIMFDFMLTGCVLVAMIGAWDAYRTGRLRSWAIFGLGAGLGALAKGPVILVHILPVVLLFPLAWREGWAPGARRQWYLGAGFGIVMGTAIGLAWAIPAAIHGGHNFAHMIFWEQSAGRMAKSFAHRRGPLFYLPVMAGFLAPLAFWRPFWQSLSAAAKTPRDATMTFLLCWTAPAFVAFSLISGKQVHYLMPILPGVAIMLAALLDQRAPETTKSWGMVAIFPVLLAFAALIAAQFVPVHLSGDNHALDDGLHACNPLAMACGIVASAAVMFLLGRKPAGQLVGIAFALFIFMGIVVFEDKAVLLNNYDLRPISAALQKYKSHPLAWVHTYAGEIGFLARLDTPVDDIDPEQLSAWFADHPDGIAVVRYGKTMNVKNYNILFTQPYREGEHISIVASNVVRV